MFGPYLDALLRITTAFLKHPRLFPAHLHILSEKLPQGKFHTKFNYRILETPTLVSRLFPYLIRQVVTRKDKHQTKFHYRVPETPTLVSRPFPIR